MLFKRGLLYLFFISLLAVSSCAVIGGIFKAGMWFGILLIVIVIGIVVWLLKRLRR